MKKRVTLIFPKWTEDYGIFSHFVNRTSAWPPLNLSYIAAIAEQKGFEAKIIDGQAENKDLETVLNETLDFDPGVVGVTTTTPFHHIAERVVRLIKKETDAVTVVGGPHITVTLNDPRSFTDVFDYGFIGESESSWAEFLERYDTKQSLNEVKGIIFHDNGNIVNTGKANTPDPKKIPWPARHLLNPGRYMMGTLQGLKQFTTIKSVRGCPFKCTFCSTDVFGYKLTKYNPTSIIEEIKHVVNTQDTRHFIFLDETLTANKKHISEICDLIIQEKLDITFEGGTRANLIDEPLMEKMTRAGLIRIGFGLETVDDNIRKIMRKEVPLEAHDIVNQLANKYGVEATNSCIIGMPGETKETIRKTLRYLRLTPEIRQANVTIAVPYPGTELAEQAKKGEYGLKILTDKYSDYRRYNAAVMQVGDLGPKDLVRLQNDAFLSIYALPSRWIPMYRKQGFMGVLITLSRFLNCLKEGRWPDFVTNKQLGIKNGHLNGCETLEQKVHAKLVSHHPENKSANTKYQRVPTNLNILNSNNHDVNEQYAHEHESENSYYAHSGI